MENVLVSKAQVTDYIPHREPFIFVDELLVCEEKKAVGRFTVPQQHVFVEDGLFQNAGLIEHIAQTMALKAGYLARKQGNPPVMGFLAAVQSFECSRQVRAGETLCTEALTIVSAGTMLAVKAKVYREGEVIAECQLRLVEETKSSLSS